MQPLVLSWLDKNPSYKYERLTQATESTWVRRHFTHRTDIISTFTALRDGILRADLERYLFLYASGGIYTDLDTECLKPISSWIPAAYKNCTNLVLGIEGDSLGGPPIDGFTYQVQFSTWTIMAKPRHYLVEQIMNRAQSQIHALAAEQNSTVSEMQVSYMDVMDTTGPGMFADTVYKGLSSATNSSVTSANFTGLTRPRLVGDVLILPVTAFAPGMPHSNAGDVEDEAALVRHLLRGSWKGAHQVQRRTRRISR
ncbi:hypothetical protein MMC21_007462 [Puttea exsequens]|nr:hypothetical protein [Puttea exsequens]